MILSFKASNDEEVCGLLNKFKDRGWNLNNFFIKITNGPDGYTVFYDSNLHADPRK